MSPPLEIHSSRRNLGDAGEEPRFVRIQDFYNARTQRSACVTPLLYDLGKQYGGNPHTFRQVALPQSSCCNRDFQIRKHRGGVCAGKGMLGYSFFADRNVILISLGESNTLRRETESDGKSFRWPSFDFAQIDLHLFLRGGVAVSIDP